MPTIRLQDVTKLYHEKKRLIVAVQDVNLEIAQGEFVFVVGSRGAGKSALLGLLGGDLKPEEGNVYLDDTDMWRGSKRKRAKLRERIGKVPQDSGLVRTATVYQNLAPPLPTKPLRRGADNKTVISKALSLVGMAGCEERYPLEFSITECRRIELAKAILKSPSILLLDEMTERMDNDTIWDLTHLLREMNRRGTTVIMSTHASQVVNILRKRVITLVDGRILGDVQKGRFGDIV